MNRILGKYFVAGAAPSEVRRIEWNNVSLVVARILVFIKARSLRSLTCCC